MKIHFFLCLINSIIILVISMEEKKKTVKKSTTKKTPTKGGNVSYIAKKTKKRSSTQLKKMSMSSDDIFEQVMLKKQKRVEARAIRLSKKELMELSNDDLFDHIMAKSASKKAKRKVRENLKKEQVVESLKTEITIENSKDECLQEPVISLDEAKNEEEHLSLEDIAKAASQNESSDIFIDTVNDKKTNKIFRISMVSLVVVIFIFVGILLKSSISFSTVNDLEVVKSLDAFIDTRPAEYDSCLKNKYTNDSFSLMMQEYIDELNNELDSTPSVSVLYKDLTNDFSFSKGEENVYYAASTMKSLAALYIYSKALNGELDLEDTVTYSSKFRVPFSPRTSQYKYGDKITLRELVKNSVEVSDNSAYLMLVSYIGTSTLREFGNSLGAVHSLAGADYYGNINLNDGYIYMYNLFEFFNTAGDLGVELESYFLAADQNSFSDPDNNVLAAHKYGSYDIYYNDIGIVYDAHPYVLVVLTHYGYNSDNQQLVRSIADKVKILHNHYYEAIENYCYTSIYK